MKNRRYPEGGDIPSLSFPPIVETTTEEIRRGRRTKYLVPAKAGISSTSEAKACFVERQFSKKLQQFMLNYAYTLVTTKVLSGEV